MRWLFAAMLIVAGCKSSKVNDGNAIDLTISADSSVSDEDLAHAANLELEVSGAEMYASPLLALAGKFDTKTRTARVRYRPGQVGGTISIRATIMDESGVPLAVGELDDVALNGATQLLTITISRSLTGSDGGSDGGGATCGDGVVDSGELCDPGSGSAKPCPQSSNDCDDANPCTTDALTGSGCQATCSHTPLADATGCMAGSAAGVCVSGACCTGCIKNGVCMAGSSDATACGAGGNSCFDCTQNSATATCNAGNCSGCDATSCTTEGRTCGTSSCGYNCGGCADGCSNGTLTHYACVNKTCQMNGSGNCGLYAACASSTTCATDCMGDDGCVATAWCGAAKCKPKLALGAALQRRGNRRSRMCITVRVLVGARWRDRVLHVRAVYRVRGGGEQRHLWQRVRFRQGSAELLRVPGLLPPGVLLGALAGDNLRLWRRSEHRVPDLWNCDLYEQRGRGRCTQWLDLHLELELPSWPERDLLGRQQDLLAL
jgi:hypothetical protein